MSEYSGSSTGWVKERFLRQRRWLPDLTVGTEASDAIAVTIQCRTFEGDGNEYVDADEAVELMCSLFDANGLESLVAAFTMAETGAGTVISATAKPRLILTTDAAGSATVTITDVVGTFVGSIYLLVQPLNKPGFPSYVKLTFAE